MLKPLTAVLAIVIVAMIAASAGLAQAQGLPAAPTGLSVAAVDWPDQVTVSWQAADGATLCRIGWVAFDKITAVQNAGRPWLDASLLRMSPTTDRPRTSRTACCRACSTPSSSAVSTAGLVPPPGRIGPI